MALKISYISRSVYTRRIVDISAKVRKQKEEIDRVLADTRTIQKEINTLSGKLERTFTVVEGLAYKVSTVQFLLFLSMKVILFVQGINTYLYFSISWHSQDRLFRFLMKDIKGIIL